MIWRLTYCNKEGVQARLDIIRGASTPVEVIEGTATPFILNYKLDKTDKSGFFMTSSADISIFETASFNIDNLKTSNETEIKVEHYINNILDWSGFVIPDFFSKTIGTPATVEMVASDRLGTLKSVTIEPTTATISISDLFTACLSKTGLSLSLYTQLPFTSVAGAESILNTKVSTQRFSNTKNRNISCYDILKSLLVMTNSIIVQRKGQWAVINKYHLEQGGAPSTVKAFSNIMVGGRKTIIPVASSVGVYQEFGGGRIHPVNYDYNLDLSGWTPKDGFVASINDKAVAFFDSGTGQPLYTTTTTKKYLVNNINNPVNSYLSSGDLIIPYGEGTSVDVKVNINAITGATPLTYPNGSAKVLYSVVAKKGTELKYLNRFGAFIESTAPIKLMIAFPQNLLPVAMARASMFEGTLQVAEGEFLSDYTIEIRMYAPPYAYTSLINEFGISFSVENEIAKGNIYKTTQGANYTKEHEIDTSIFGDYITVGLNGYFYPYLLDDASSLLTSAGELTTRWTTPTDTNELPLLQHVTRQKSRMFSAAHDLLSIEIDENSFDPLTLYQDCNSKKYVVVSASYDFLRSELRADIQQIEYDNTIQKRDYIYSYFGDGESGISSVGGISGGGTGTGGGGGMTPEQIELLNTVAGYWTLDENGNLKTTYNAYSEQELSAYGFGGSGGGGGGLIETVYGYSSLGGTFSNADLNNTFNAYTINQLHLRIETLESGGGSGSVTSVALSAPTGFTVSGSPVTSSGTLNLAFAAGYSLPTTAKQTAWDNHLSATNNPHGVTAAQINGLSVSPTEGALGLRSIRLGGTGLKWTPQPTTLEAIRTGIGFGWRDTEWVIGNIRGGSIDSYGFGIGYVQGDGTLGGEFRIAVGGLAYLNNVQIATINSNVASATKLRTSRTIWGQSFDGTGNISGALTGVTNITASGAIITSSTLSKFGNIEVGAGLGNQIERSNGILYLQHTSANSLSLVNGGGNVGIGTTSPSYKLDVNGTGRFTGDLTAPKVIFNAAGWSMVQVGTELQMQYNGVAKMRFLNGGSIVAVQEITAYS